MVLVFVQIPVLVLVHTISTVLSEDVHQYMTPTTEDKIPTLRPAAQVFSLRTQFIPIPHFFTTTPLIGPQKHKKVSQSFEKLFILLTEFGVTQI